MTKQILTLFILIGLFACNNTDKNKIEVTAWLISVRGIKSHVSELPRSGMTIQIDTVAKKIHIPLSGIINEEIIQYLIETDNLPYYNPQTQSVDITINKIENKPEGILFHTEANNEQFICTYLETAFCITTNGSTYMFAGGEEAKEKNKELNDLKQTVYDSINDW